MNVEFFCDSGANIHSCNRETVDLDEEFAITDGEWLAMSDDEKFEVAKDWANNSGLEIGFEEV